MDIVTNPSRSSREANGETSTNGGMISSPKPRRLIKSARSPLRGVRKVIVGKSHFSVRPMSQDERHVNDEIYGSIYLPPAVHAILDTPAVQRLGLLVQLGNSNVTYPCCTHTRKEHSLGVMYLCGKVVETLMHNQPQLGLTKMDVLCVMIAGLCHDLGHGPFSHAFEGFLHTVYKKEKDHPEQYNKRNKRFKEEFGVDIPSLPKNYKHENTSLIMVDFLLANLGLQIDWDHLDKPLKQIGDGLDAERFGLVQDDSEEIVPFKSRDFVFIKECIYGKPLDYPDILASQTAFVGRDKNKEFLYQIVNNKFNGWDMDRGDYFQRDSSAATREGANYSILLREVRVCRGTCPIPDRCYECKDKTEPGEHLMLCHPFKLVGNAMTFFNQRIKNHDEIYTHKKTVSGEKLLIDLLVEADKEYDMLLSTQKDDNGLPPVQPQYDNFPYSKLPISRAWMYPRLFTRLDDSIIGIIQNKIADAQPNAYPTLKPLMNRFRGHDFYKCVGEIEIEVIGGAEMWCLSEDEIIEDIVSEEVLYDVGDGVVGLNKNDFIIEKRELHCGSKENNPVCQMRFFSKSDVPKLKNLPEKLPLAVEVDEASLPMNTLKSFIKRSIRMYSRSPEKNEMLTMVFENWISHKEERLRAPPGCSLKTFIEDTDHNEEGNGSQPALLTQEEIATPAPKRAKRKLGL